MEKDNSRKRTRDEGDENKECHKGKKLEITISPLDQDSSYGEKGCEFCDAIGVFDFPWLKEGPVFGVDEYLEPQDMFPPCLYVDEIQDTSISNLDQSCVQNSLVPPTLDQNFHDNEFDGDGLWLFQVDDLEPLDCIWSCAIDQPLDNICLHKA